VKIRWTKRARDSFDQIVDYIQNEWSQDIASNFIKNTVSFLDLLKEQAEIGRTETIRKDLRSFVLSRHVTVFYRIKDNDIIIILKFFDTRQDPEKRMK
jgi:plasmid stabilization system protein ParE